MSLWLYLAASSIRARPCRCCAPTPSIGPIPPPQHRVAVVERAPILGLLFLHNNLHVAHHDRPGAPWHRLPALYARDRERLLSANGGLVYDGYGEVLRRFLLTPHDQGHSSPTDGAAA
jgi:fatty acid desaturase